MRHKLLPVLVRDDRMFVAMAAPTEKKVIDELEFVTGKRVFPHIALAGPLQRVISARPTRCRDRGECVSTSGPTVSTRRCLRKAGLVPGQTPEQQPPGGRRPRGDAASCRA